jgi:hypothetical protein
VRFFWDKRALLTLREVFNGLSPNLLGGAENYESQNYTRLHRMQAKKLRHKEKQEKRSGQT